MMDSASLWLFPGPDILQEVVWRHVCLLPSEFIVESREEQHTEEVKWRWERLKSVPGDFNQVQLKLHPYCTYRFRVIAVNDLGHSNSSEPSNHHSTPPAGKWPQSFWFKVCNVLRRFSLKPPGQKYFVSIKVSLKGIIQQFWEICLIGFLGSTLHHFKPHLVLTLFIQIKETS